ncbi:MAG: SMP-30/gluconolactonase/LRE family protein, partial [Myxococcales bacterium]|nr:SMP-30/gluconolactonase/LRE family protein [Myxococcales bacterium]
MTYNHTSMVCDIVQVIVEPLMTAISLSTAATIGEPLIFDDRFRRFGPEPSARPARVATGMVFTEGPCWFDDGGYLLFSDVRDDKIWRYEAGSGQTDVFRAPS